MKVRKFREYLESAAKKLPLEDAALASVVNAFFTGLRRHDRESVEKALGMFIFGAAANTEKARSPQVDHETVSAAEKAAVDTLKDAFDDDAEFRSSLEEIRSSRAITRDGLNRVYCQLFGKSRTISSKVTKTKIAQDIADLRLERVRSKKAAQFFAAE